LIANFCPGGKSLPPAFPDEVPHVHGLWPVLYFRIAVGALYTQLGLINLSQIALMGVGGWIALGLNATSLHRASCRFLARLRRCCRTQACWSAPIWDKCRG
jgi:hypothetical protein